MSVKLYQSPKIKRAKIILFLKLPPPTTGATLINQYVNKSKLLRANFHVRTLEISYSKNVVELGKINVKKAFVFLKTWLNVLKELIFRGPDIIYFQIIMFLSLYSLWYLRWKQLFGAYSESPYGNRSKHQGGILCES